MLIGKDEIWYGAGNLHRHPYGGRAGQYWSEDPTLDYFNGYYEAQAMQGVGVTMCVKHMCCNDQEAQRHRPVCLCGRAGPCGRRTCGPLKAPSPAAR